ncbi:hypothetical protein GQ457_01G017010 [Hibiscus cannabinus]
MRIVLNQERKEYVIKEPVSNEPGTNAPRANKHKFKKHMDDMLDVGCRMSYSFKQFILKFIDKTLSQLLGMLRTAESNVKRMDPTPFKLFAKLKERERKRQSLRVMESPNPKKRMH